MLTDITPLSALLLLAVGVLVGVGWHLGGVVVSAIQNGARGMALCIIIAAVIVVVAIVL